MVVVGRLNPWILQPAWLREHKIISRSEFEGSETNKGQSQLVYSELTQLDFGAIKLLVDMTRFTVTCTEEPLERAKDFALGCFRLLSHTPVGLLGLNKTVNVRFSSPLAWHKFGDLIAPKKPWSSLLSLSSDVGRTGGLRAMIMELSKRPDDLQGYIRVQVDVLTTGHPDISIQVNDHMSLHADGKEADGGQAARMIDENWQTSMRRADSIVADLLKGCSDD